MTVEATLIKDSVALSNGTRITTFLLRYPKFIHGELMTHRAFSRNASSSRAIPISRMIADVQADMAKPLEFRKKKKGMQAGDPFGPIGQWLATKAWRFGGHVACAIAWLMEKGGIHKQYANRILEPYMHISVVVTATEYANWFALRNHPAAQPEIQALAQCMWELWLHNIPRPLMQGMWHLPFVNDLDMFEAFSGSDENMALLIRRSVACCARTSYLNHDKSSSTQAEDNALHDRLVAENPKHASPTEHQATPMEPLRVDYDSGATWSTSQEWSGNFRGWNQYRKKIKNENIETYSQQPDYLTGNPFEGRLYGNLVGESHKVSRR